MPPDPPLDPLPEQDGETVDQISGSPPAPEPDGAVGIDALPPVVRRAFDAATKHADEVLVAALLPAGELGVETANRTVAQIQQKVTELLGRHLDAEAAVLRDLVVDEAAARILVDTEVIPALVERFRLAITHIEPAQQYTSEVREALSVVVARALLTVSGASRIGEGIGWVSGNPPRIVVASPLRNQQALLDAVRPGLRQQAQQLGIPIEYVQVRIDEQGQLTLQRVTGTSTPESEPESGLRYYTEAADIAWMNELVDERSFAQKLSEVSYVTGRENLLGGTGAEEVVKLTFDTGLVAVEKTLPSVEQADAEELMSLVFRAAGQPAPEVVRVSDRVVRMEFVPGMNAEEAVRAGNWAERAWVRYYDTPSGRRIGKVDFLIGSSDRFLDTNWRIHERRKDAWPIDNVEVHGRYFNGFVRRFVATATQQPIRHNIPRAELAADRQRIMMLGPEFIRLNRLGWFLTILHNLTVLEANAQDGPEPPRPAGPAEVMAVLERSGDRLIDQLAVASPVVAGWIKTPPTPQRMRQDLARLRRRAAETGYDQTDIVTLDSVVKLYAHAEMQLWSAEDLANSPEVGEQYLELVTQRLDDLKAYSHHQPVPPSGDAAKPAEWIAHDDPGHADDCAQVTLSGLAASLEPGQLDLIALGAPGLAGPPVDGSLRRWVSSRLVSRAGMRWWPRCPGGKRGRRRRCSRCTTRAAWAMRCGWCTGGTGGSWWFKRARKTSISRPGPRIARSRPGYGR